jgi:PhoH-like ATPase
VARTCGLGHHRAQPRAELRAQPADGPEIDFVTLLGTAGTGKTLLALAAGLAQVLDEQRYREIIMTRATVSVGEDIGFLPGTEEEKMDPWMGALDDNLEVLTHRATRKAANGAAPPPTT